MIIKIIVIIRDQGPGPRAKGPGTGARGPRGARISNCMTESKSEACSPDPSPELNSRQHNSPRKVYESDNEDDEFYDDFQTRILIVSFIIWTDSKSFCCKFVYSQESWLIMLTIYLWLRKNIIFRFFLGEDWNLWNKNFHNKKNAPFLKNIHPVIIFSFNIKYHWWTLRLLKVILDPFVHWEYLKVLV